MQNGSRPVLRSRYGAQTHRAQPGWSEQPAELKVLGQTSPQKIPVNASPEFLSFE